MTSPEPGPAPTTLLWSVRLLLAEAVALAALTAYLIWHLVSAAGDRGIGTALVVSAALAAVALAAVGRGLARRHAAARGPAVVAQILLLVVGYYMIEGGLRWPGIAVLVVGLATGVLIVSPPTTRGLGLD